MLIIVPAVGSGLGDRRVADRSPAGARYLPAKRRDQLMVHPVARTEDRENRDLGTVAPYLGVLEAAVILYKKFHFIG